jgi:virulence-associated protein VapD
MQETLAPKSIPAGRIKRFRELPALPWFARSVRDIRAFRVEQWSDFTSVMKAP